MFIPQDIILKAETTLSDYTKNSLQVLSCKQVSGGCIHYAAELLTTSGKFFIKYNRAGEFENFNAESEGLTLLNKHSSGFVPEVIAVEKTDEHSFILMEFIEKGSRGKNFWKDFAEKLSGLHRHSHDYFGLGYDNFIGRLPQSNKQHIGFVEFFVEERLLPQLQLAKQNGYADFSLIQKFEKLFPLLPSLIPSEKPALLHGDLWSGNFLVNKKGGPMVVDPAVYYGHREAEIAFTKLFGGFDEEFYEAYNEVFPLQKGWEERIDIFNLYPLLVHLNLFGLSYRYDIESILYRYQ